MTKLMARIQRVISNCCLQWTISYLERSMNHYRASFKLDSIV